MTLCLLFTVTPMAWNQGQSEAPNSTIKINKSCFNAIFLKIKIHAKKIHDEQNVKIFNKKDSISIPGFSFPAWLRTALLLILVFILKVGYFGHHGFLARFWIF